MSQEKVDRRKYEKHNRKKLERQRKIKFTIKCVVAAVGIGAIIGVPLGINYYRSIPKFVGDSTVESFISEYIDDEHAADVPDFADSEEDTEEASDETSEEETEESSSEDSDQTSEESDDTENEADSEQDSEE